MRKSALAIALIATTILAGASTIAVTAQVEENTKFSPERLIEIEERLAATM
ncbi:MAG: hypothetical protein AAF390_07070 [Pseudomonadota bacterium]